MKKILLLIFPLLLLNFSAFAQASSNSIPDRSDNQIWHETIVSIPLTEKLSLNFNGVLRYSNDAERFGDKRAGVGFSYSVNKYLSAGGQYLYRKTEFRAGQENYENRYVASLTLSKTFRKIELANRNQFEYHSRNRRSDKINYRNRLLAEREVKLEKFAFKPFASAEVFYDSDFETFSRLRLTAGISKEINKNFTLDAYYLRQQDGRNTPGDLNVFGTTLRITLQ